MKVGMLKRMKQGKKEIRIIIEIDNKNGMRLIQSGTAVKVSDNTPTGKPKKDNVEKVSDNKNKDIKK